MQKDFHHAATYVLARLAGFIHKEAQTVAYASQYVDDSTNKGTIRFDNGDTYQHIASAHTVFDFDHNFSNGEDYEVWVPFHFLPGNKGLPSDQIPTAPVSQRLLCTDDSPLANDMWIACRECRDEPNALHRLGITSHVYVDTFSHQDFAGVKNDVNIVYKLKHINPAESNILESLEGFAADGLKLGHGAAGIDPDLPFLEWSYENGSHQYFVRSNPQRFLDASNRLFEQFVYYRGAIKSPDFSNQDQNVFKNVISSNLNPDPAIRHQGWLDRLRNGEFSFGALSGTELADIQYVPIGPGSWKYAALGTTEKKDSPDKVFSYSSQFAVCDWKKFHDALMSHQNEVLNVILPKYRLPASYDAARAAGL
jgi:hypothetical protein